MGSCLFKYFRVYALFVVVLTLGTTQLADSFAGDSKVSTFALLLFGAVSGCLTRVSSSAAARVSLSMLRRHLKERTLSEVLSFWSSSF